MRLYILIIILSVVISGCTTMKMEVADHQELPELNSDKSRVVFLRNASHGTQVEPGMYQIVNEGPRFIGVLRNATKMYIDVKPGNHTFASHSINIRFVSADMIAGKTYYVVVSPRGWPAINFTNYPVRNNETGEFQINGDDFKRIEKSTKLVNMSPMAIKWAEKRQKRLDSVFEVEWPLWKEKPESFRSAYTLNSEDGV